MKKKYYIFFYEVSKMEDVFLGGGSQRREMRDAISKEERKEKLRNRRARGLGEPSYTLHVLYCGSDSGYTDIKALLESVGKIGVHYQELDTVPNLGTEQTSLSSVDAIIVDCMVAEGALLAEGILDIIAEEGAMPKTIFYHGIDAQPHIGKYPEAKDQSCPYTEPTRLASHFDRLLQQKTSRQQ